MADWEQQFLAIQTLKPYVWWHFLDDIFSLLVHRRAALDRFLSTINEFHLTIRFTFTISLVEGIFLYTGVYVENQTLEMDLFVQTMDKHQ